MISRSSLCCNCFLNFNTLYSYFLIIRVLFQKTWNVIWDVSCVDSSKIRAFRHTSRLPSRYSSKHNILHKYATRSKQVRSFPCPLWSVICTCPPAKMTGDPEGLGRYGIVTPLGGDCTGDKAGECVITWQPILNHIIWTGTFLNHKRSTVSIWRLYCPVVYSSVD